MEILTPDNIQLSDLKNGRFDSDDLAINCKIESLPDEVLNFVRDSRAANTRRAYASDLQHFLLWGGEVPASALLVAQYITAQAEHLKPATLSRRIASIAVAHKTKGLASPTSSELVRSVLKGVRRIKGTAQMQAKPLLRDELFVVLDVVGDSLKDTRDRAMLLLGFAGGFRRSELVGLDVPDIEYVRQGMVINLRYSKTDQERHGRKIGIPFGRTKNCPVKAIETWLQRASIVEGPIFRPINRHGHTVSQRLSGKAVAEVVRERLMKAGINPEAYSGHSLRSGFATSAAMAGVATWRIRKQTGHANDGMLSRYIRDGQLFDQNAAGSVL